MLKTKEIPGQNWEEFGLLKTVILENFTQPFLVVEHRFLADLEERFHLTLWSTNFTGRLTTEATLLTLPGLNDLFKIMGRMPEANQPPGRNLPFPKPYVELKSSYNIADLVTKMLPLGSTVSNLPLKDIEKALNRVYLPYKKV